MSTRFRYLLFLAALAFSSQQTPAADFTYQILSTNLPPGNPNTSNAGLIQGSDGNFYGTTYDGGSRKYGSIYKVTPTGVVTTVAEFDGTNGLHPATGLVQGSDGNYYGVTSSAYSAAPGGTNQGVIYRMTPAGALTPIHVFSSYTSTNWFEGGGPEDKLIQAKDGYFYGTTEYGGTNFCGTIFKINSQGDFKTLATLPSKIPRAYVAPSDLIQGVDGNFYGTTRNGGTSSLGSVFRMTPDGAITNLVSFGGTNGLHPYAGLLQAKDGNFYGTTRYANIFLGPPSELYAGLVFKMSPEGALTTVGLFDTNNGAWPIAPVIEGPDGAIYGASEDGGSFFKGTLFKVAPEGVLSTLVLFNGANGSNPQGGLVLGKDGNFYGSTYSSTSGGGIFYRLSVHPPAPQPQTITFLAVGSADIHQQLKLTATASSGLPVSYVVVSGPALVYNGVLTFLGEGTVKVHASQAGNYAFKPAAGVSIKIVVRKTFQRLSPFKIIPGQTYAGSWLSFQTPAPVANSGLPVKVAVKAGAAQIDTNAPPTPVSLIVTGPGPVTLTAEQPGDTYFAPAQPVSTSFTVKMNQTVTFPPLGSIKLGVSTPLRATASSGLPVTYKVSGPAQLSNDAITVTGPGVVDIRAYQLGNGLYHPAPVAKRSYTIK